MTGVQTCALPIFVSEDVLRDYRIVVDSYIAYREEEERLNLPLDKRHRPNRATAEARGGKGAPTELKEGDLTYAIVERNRDGSHFVRQLLPVMIDRRAYRVSPRDLAEAQGILPVSDRDEATAAF